MRAKRVGRQLLLPVAMAAALIASSNAVAETEELPLETEIVSATVYAGQAQVVRSGEVAVRAGTFRLVCGDIPRKLIESSLSVEATGLGDARIVGIDLRRVEEQESKPPKYVELDAELDGLEGDLAALKIEAGAIRRRQRLTESLGELSAREAREDITSGAFSTTQWRTIMAFLEEESVETERRERALEEQMHDVRERIAWVAAELSEMRVPPGSGREIVIECEAETPGVLSIELTYLVPDAAWAPEYTVRHIERDNQIELTYSSSVAQATGEDWEGISVVLSTATPQVGAAPPDLLPLFLGQTTGTVRGRVTDAQTGAPLGRARVSALGTPHATTTEDDGSYVLSEIRAGLHTIQVSRAGYHEGRRTGVHVVGGRTTMVEVALRPVVETEHADDDVKIRPINTKRGAIATQPGVVLHEDEVRVRGGRSSEVKAYVGTPEVPQIEIEAVRTELAANLVLPRPLELPTGAEPRRALVARRRLSGDFVLEAVPRLSEHVFVRGTFENELDVPILPGRADVYVETVPEGSETRISDFVGRLRLEGVAVGEEFTTYLGVDQNVEAEHELESRKVLSESDDARTKIGYRYRISLESFRREPVTVLVLDRVPVSAMRDVDVEDVEIKPEPSEQGEDGLVTWEVTLAPGERREFVLSYEVEYPSRMSPRDLGLEE